MTEEIVFRACVLSIYHLSGASRQYMIYFAPLTFGLGQLFTPFSLSLSFLTVLFLRTAHVHHAWDTYNRYGRTWIAARRALITSGKYITCSYREKKNNPK